MATLDVAEIRFLSDAQLESTYGAILDIAEIRLLADDPTATGAILEIAEIRVLSSGEIAAGAPVLDIAEIRMLGAVQGDTYLEIAEIRLLGGNVITPVPSPGANQPAVLRLEPGYWMLTQLFRLDEFGEWQDVNYQAPSTSP